MSLLRVLGYGPDARTAGAAVRDDEEDAMSYRLAILAALFTLATLAAPASAVTITFETRPDGTPIQNQGGGGCGEITFETFRPWGVLLTPPEGYPLNIKTTLDECLSGPNALGVCAGTGTLNITFVWPGTNTSTVVSGIDLAMLTSSSIPWNGAINTYDPEGALLDRWVLPATGFCREPPAYYDYYHFSAPGRIARIECMFKYTGIDDLMVTGVSTLVEGSTWGMIKATYP
jgi:hypothetical protein